jgi:hypothetical protein
MSKPRNADTNTLAFPKLPPRRRRLKITREHRRRVENAVEAMINFLNEVDDVEAEGADDDHPVDDDELEGGDDGKDPESEPSLGASTEINQERAWSFRQNPTTDDCEQQNEDGEDREISELEHYGEADGDNGGIVDDEPSLGSLDGRMSQLRWSAPDRPVLWPNTDLEHDEAEFEGGAD